MPAMLPDLIGHTSEVSAQGLDRLSRRARIPDEFGRIIAREGDAVRPTSAPAYTAISRRLRACPLRPTV